MAGNETITARAISVPSIVDHYTDAELNSGYHSKVEYEQAIERYGTIYKVIDFGDLTKKADIEKAARDWIKEHYFDGVLSFNVKAVDLHLLGFDQDKIHVGDQVTVEFIDLYHVPVRKTLTCMSVQMDILNPANTSYKIGIPDSSLNTKFHYTNNRTSTSRGSRTSSGDYSSTGGSVTQLYKLYKEVEEKAEINAEQIDLIAQQVNIQADNIEMTALATDSIQGDVQGTAVFQNEAEIINIAGAFNVKEDYYDDWPLWDITKDYHAGDRVRFVDPDNKTHGYLCIKDAPASWNISITNEEYWHEVKGRKGVELLDGAAFELDDLNGVRQTVGKKLGEHDEHFATYDGSALWTQREHIVGVAGEYDIYTDPNTGVKTLIIKSGGGIKIRRNETEFGLYDEDTLMGGIIVDKINTASWPAWTSGVHYDVGQKVTINGNGWICKVAHDSGNRFDSSKWDRYTAINTKIEGDQVDIKARQLIELGVYTDDTLTGGIIAEKVNAVAFPNWASGKHYKVGDNVIYDGRPYTCSAEHDSVSSFDPSKWNTYHATKINFNQLDSNVSDYTALGLYDDDTLTAGILVQKINDSDGGTSTETRLLGDRILTGDSLVKGYLSSDGKHFYSDSGKTIEIAGRSGVLYGERTTDKVYYWNGTKFVETSRTLGMKLSNMEGLIAEKATIGELNAVKARVEDLEVENQRVNGTLSVEDDGLLLVKRHALFGSIGQGGVQISGSGVSIGSGGSLSFTGSQTGEYYSFNSTNIQGIIKEVSVANNVLTLTPVHGDPINFSKATSLSGAWDSGVYKVSAKQTNYNTTTQQNETTTVAALNYDPPMRLNGSEQASNFSAEIYEVSGSSQIARKSVYGYLQLNSNGANSSVKVNTKSDGTGTNVANLDVGSIYTAGQNNVTITKGSWSSGQISFTKSAGTASTKSVQLTAATTTWSGNTASRVIWDGTAADAQHGVSTGYTVTVDASGRYTAGENAVTITKGSWSNGQISFTKSAGTASTKSVQLTAASTTWSGNTGSRVIWDGTAADAQHGVSTGYTVSIDASGRYTAGETAGKNAVTITKGSWSNGQISFTKSAGTASTKSVQLTAAATTWSGNTGSRVIWDGTAADAQHGVSTGYTVSVDASGRYNAGGATAKVNQSTQTLGYGGSVTVTAQYVNSSGTTVSTSSSCTISAPTDSNLVAGNIKNGVTIFGVAGTYSGGGNIDPATDISLNSPTWYNSTDSLPSANATLNTMGSVFNSHKNGRGYIYFNITISGVSGKKVYRVPIGT